MSKEIPISTHLKELRQVFLISFIAFFAMTMVSYLLLREPVMDFIISPASQYHIDLKFTGVSEAFMAYMKISVLSGIIFASPIIFWQVLKFILPGLYSNEKKVFIFILFWMIVLFLCGISFAYFVVLKYALKALLFDFSGAFEPFITVNNYLGFVSKFIIPFGIVFEIPLLIFFLTKLELVTPESLKKYRRYIIVIIVIIAGVFSPPDVVSQVMLALPMYVLYELSILVSKWVYSKIRHEETDE